MIKKNFLTAAIAAAALSSGVAYADDHGDMEKCKVAMNGKGLIKEHKGDCGGKNASCAGNNKAGDPDAWILVPKGECDKINHGDFSGVSDDVKDRIDMDMMKNMMEGKMDDKMDDMKDKMDDMKDKMDDMKDKMDDMKKDH